MNSGAPQKLTIFLCHASEDKPKVRELYIQLINDGYDVWLDEEKLIPGHDWRNEITKAVRVSNIVIVCLSRKSVNKEGFVQKEIHFALDVAEEKPEKTVFIIPAKLEKCNVPDRLNRWHWVDLFSDNGYKKLKQALDLRYENLYKRKRRLKRPLGLNNEEINQSLNTTNLANHIPIDITPPLDEKNEKGLDDSKSKTSPIVSRPLQGPKSKPKTKSGILIIGLLALGAFFVFFLILIFAIASNLNDVKPTLTPDLIAASTSTVHVSPTSTPTVQVSPIGTSIAQVSPIPEDQEFFKQEFDGPLSNAWSNFIVPGSDQADPGKVTVEPQGGKLVWDFEGEQLYYYLLYEGFSYTDVKVEVRADNRGKNNNAISLFCRYDPEVGWYEFNIANNGLYDIFYADATGDSIGYNRITNGGSNAIKQGNDVNEYSITCSGEDLTLTINGEEVNTIAERKYGLIEGGVGVSVSSFNDLPILVDMEWFKVSQP